MLHVSRRDLLISFGAAAAAGALPWVAPARAQGKIRPGPEDALIVVDVQNCFVPGGPPL